MPPVGNNSDGFSAEKNSSSAAAAPGAAKKSSDRSVLLYTVLAVVLALAVRACVVAPYLVSGPSMEPTFQNLDYLLVQKLTVCVPFTTSECAYLGEPQRGDVIVFKMPLDPSETLIKRVIGLPGDTLVFSGNAVTVKDAQDPEGFTLSEPYLSPDDLGGPTGMTITVPQGDYFVLGDNRKVSYDSRSWGDLPRADVIGKVFMRLYPLKDIGIYPGEARYQAS